MARLIAAMFLRACAVQRWRWSSEFKASKYSCRDPSSVTLFSVTKKSSASARWRGRRIPGLVTSWHMLFSIWVKSCQSGFSNVRSQSLWALHCTIFKSKWMAFRRWWPVWRHATPTCHSQILASGRWGITLSSDSICFRISNPVWNLPRWPAVTVNL